MAFKQALESNRIWASRLAKSDPTFFPKAAEGQAPRILWLGCSDSRVPETTVCGLKPGEIFTHRNIANIISPTDINALSVIEYAVKYLKVQHVVLCGHTSCGGVAGTLGNVKLGVIDIWLQPMRALREKYSEVLDQLSGDAKTTKMSELNVQEGVNNIRRIPAVVDAMRERQMELHGVIYDLGSGVLREVDTAEPEHHVSRRTAAFEMQS